MTKALALLGLLGPIAFMLLVVILAKLSKRIGAILKRAPIYRWYYVAVALIAIGVVFRVAAMDSEGRLASEAALLYDIPVIIGLLIALVITWRYWGWMLYERDTKR